MQLILHARSYLFNPKKPFFFWILGIQLICLFMQLMLHLLKIQRDRRFPLSYRSVMDIFRKVKQLIVSCKVLLVTFNIYPIPLQGARRLTTFPSYPIISTVNTDSHSFIHLTQENTPTNTFFHQQKPTGKVGCCLFNGSLSSP